MKRISLWLVMLVVFLSSMSLVCGVNVFAQESYEIEDDTSAGNDAEEGLVSLDFKDADLKDVLKVFSQQSGLNFVADRNIEEKLITLYMNEVTVEDALKTLLDANNLGLRQNPGSNILIVRQKPTPPVETVTRVYKIQYFHDSVNPGQYMMGDKADANKHSGGSNWNSIIKPLLSEFGTVIAYTNILIITDVPDRFKLIDQVISEIDKPVPEVMIEVELIETTADFLRDLGVKWSKEFAKFTGGARITPLPYTPWNRKDLGVAESPMETENAFFRYGLISSTALTWILEMLQTDTNTKFLSKPRILVQDREWAEIKVTEDKVVSVVTIVTDDETKTYVERMEVGTILRLVPLINEEEGYVSILLEPSISRATESKFTDFNGTSYIDPQIRSMRTVVMAKSGETVAVGGFITTEDEETKTKVPWLGDIPLLGALFRHTSSDRVDKELLLFITPRIVSITEKIEMWRSDFVENAQDEASQMNKETAAGIPAAEQADAVDKPKEKPQDINAALPFREQEELGNLNIDLTLKSSSLEVIDLVK
ncbi:MAG: hypothetical protein L6416_10740 [Candidatus Omnitrophica bacterium]|nr:hypothetical protein [Candidatus Omnitrophota bacterium]